MKQFGDPLFAHLGHDNLSYFAAHIAEYAVLHHLLRLMVIVFRGGHEVHCICLVAVDQEQVGQGHQPLLAHGYFKGVLVANGEDVPAAPILNAGEYDVGQLGVPRVGNREFEQPRAGGRP